MISTCIPRRGQRLVTRGFEPVLDATRRGLCVVEEPAEVRGQHVAALLAWTPRVRHDGGRIMIEFDCGATALWLTRALASQDGVLLDLRDDRAVVGVSNPHVVLGRFGYRDERWRFRPGNLAALGIARGAVHAAGQFSRGGLRIECPGAAAMLTLVAALRRLDISARPNDTTPRVTVSGRDIPNMLARLGISDVGAQYRLLCAADENAEMRRRS